MIGTTNQVQSIHFVEFIGCSRYKTMQGRNEEEEKNCQRYGDNQSYHFSFDIKLILPKSGGSKDDIDT